MINGINVLDVAELITCVGVLIMLGAHSISSHREHRRIERRSARPAVIRVETHLEAPQKWDDMLRQMNALPGTAEGAESK